MLCELRRFSKKRTNDSGPNTSAAKPANKAVPTVAAANARQRAGLLSINEKTLAGYAQLKFDFQGGLPVDGLLGVRVVRTKDRIKGFQREPDTSTANPNDCDLESVGEMLVDMSDLYCKGDKADEQICLDIAAAEAGAGGDYEAIALALLAQIDF